MGIGCGGCRCGCLVARTPPAASRVGDPAGLPGLRIALAADRGRPLAQEVKPIRPTPRVEKAPLRADSEVPLGAEPQATLRAEPVTLGADPEVSLLIGSERDGLPDAVIAQADVVARIPIATNSLNAAMAATVALYELTRRMADQ